MGDLISRDALQKDGISVEYGLLNDDGLLLIPLRDVMKSIGNAPSVDAVKVVRCKDCKHRHSSEFCECRDADAFCSDGERRETADERKAR